MALEETFTVRGRGRFPIDMLRYDMCWPANAEAVEAIENHDNVKGARNVELVTMQHWPTERRWESFSWKILPE